MTTAAACPAPSAAPLAKYTPEQRRIAWALYQWALHEAKRRRTARQEAPANA